MIGELEKLESPIVFSHNDLLYGNVIYDEEKGEASFIDYEYGCYAFRGFDIGNHFNEFAGFECEYWRYPTKEFQLKWFEWYLRSNNNGGIKMISLYLCIQKDDSFLLFIVKPSEDEKLKLYDEVEGFSLASHFYWGLWALIQAMVSDIDFNYMDYSVLRFDEYKKRKNEIFKIK